VYKTPKTDAITPTAIIQDVWLSYDYVVRKSS